MAIAVNVVPNMDNVDITVLGMVKKFQAWEVSCRVEYQMDRRGLVSDRIYFTVQELPGEVVDAKQMRATVITKCNEHVRQTKRDAEIAALTNTTIESSI